MIYDFLFYLFAGAAIVGALLMVTRRNPIAAVVFLISVFFSTSGLFLLLDAHYIAAINIILYAGAIMVLFLFVIMLLNLGHASRPDLRRPFGGLLGGAITVGFLGVMVSRLVGGGSPAGEATGAALREAARAEGVVGLVARPLFTEYVVVLEATGLLLLVAIVGAIRLARRESA